MKKLFTFLLTLFLGLGSLTLSAQAVTVANGTETNEYIPVYGWYLDEDQHNQIIYPESMLTGLMGQTVNTLMFYLSETPSGWSSQVTLKVGTTPNSSFTTATHDLSPVSQIYSGNLTISNGILIFALDSTFTYNGGNLLLDITSLSGNYESGAFYGVAQAGGSYYEYTYDSDIQNFIPKTMFIYGSCMAPSNLEVNNITETTATISWQANGQGTDWEIYVGSSSDDLNNVTWTPVTNNTYDLQGLSANTQYTAFVRTVCGTEYSYEIGISFRTACGITPIPYIDDFESFSDGEQPTCWQFLNTYLDWSEEYPALSSYGAHSGNRALYFYTDYYSNPTAKQIAILPQMSESITDLQLSVYSKRESEYGSGTFYIGYITDPTNESTFVPLLTRTVTSMSDNNYHREIVDFSNVPVDPDSVAYIALAFQSNTSYGWYVDDIEVTLIPDCSVPVGLVANGITTNSATLTWNPGSATTFNVYYKNVNDTAYTEELNVYDSSLYIENLTHSSLYQWYVVAICTDGTLQTSEEFTFGTACAAIDSLPYFVDFEVVAPATNLPFCWTRGNENATHPYIYEYDGYNGSQSLYTYYANTVALPQIDDQEIDITTTQLSFYASAYNAGTTLLVGVMTNPNASATFVQVGSPITLTDDYQYYEVSLATYTGTGKYVAFRNPEDYATLYIDNVTLDYLPDCSRPELVWAQSIDSTSVTVAWSAVDGQTGWEVVLGPQGFSPESATAVTVSTPNHTFNNLTSNTVYDVYVRTDCGDEFSPWSNVMSFLTPVVLPATLPYACGFEDPVENAAWTFVQNGQVNQWFIDTAVVSFDGSANTMYISKDSGATNTYDHETFSVAWAFRDFQFNDANEFELSFDWKGYGESGYDYLRVFISNLTPVTAGNMTQPSSAVQLGQLGLSTDWQHASYSLGNTYSNSTRRIYFMWRNDSYMGNDPAIAVDNITITGVACAQPVNMTVTNLDTSSATITFTPATSSDAAWELMYGESDTTMVTEGLTATTFTIQNLTPGTYYNAYVRTICSDGDTSAWSPAVSFQTECAPINSVPRFWDVETNNLGGTANYPLPTCWDRGPASGSYPYISYYEAYSGTIDISFYNYYKNSAAILPVIDTNEVPVNTLQVSFYAKATSLDYYDAALIVGVFSDIYDNNTFVPVDTIVLTEDYPTMPYVVMLNNYTGNGDRIAIMNTSNTTWAYNYIYLDDITLEALPNCLPISDLTVESTDMNSITLNWTPGFDESTWNVEYKEAGDSTWSSTVATNVPFTLNNLTSATMYDIRVQADCGGDVSPWSYLQTHTQVCDSANQCAYKFVVTDGYGDGWNGGYVSVLQNGIEVAQVAAVNHQQFNTPTTDTVWVNLCDNIATELLWHTSLYNDECSFTMVDPFGTVLYTINEPVPGTLYTFNANCLVASCPAPTGITVSNIDLNSATVSWTPGGDETNWNVEYKEATATTWTVVPVTTTSYNITGLTAATLYDVRVQAECDPTNSNPSTYNTTSFGTSICAAADQCAYTFVLTDGYGDGWNGGTLEVLQNGISVTTLSATNHGGFNEMSYDTVTVNLCDNLSTSLVWSAGSFPDEAGFTLIGPDGAQLYSITNMTSYTTYTFTTACGSGPVITDPTVATAAATGISTTGATLHATITNPDNVTITAKGFQWKTTTGGTYTAVNGTGTGNTFTAALSNLTPNTSYTFKAFITFNGQTVEGSEMTFTTLPNDVEPCDVPTGLDTTTVANESITITWNANANVNSWNIQYRPVGGQWANATANTNSYTITGLTGNTDYEIQVQANCGGGNISDWTGSLMVHTHSTGLVNYLENSVVLFPNPAKEIVNVQCTMNNVQLDGELHLLDVYGKLLQIIPITSETTQINVSTLANGMYFVRVTTEEGVVTKTFVKR